MHSPLLAVIFFASSGDPPVAFSGYAEAFYQWNFNDPANNITNFRGFDNRHNTFTLANVVLDATWDDERLVGRAAFQIGHTPSSYYSSEPSAQGASGANATGAELWKYLQQTYAGCRIADDLEVTAGLFLTPIGPESVVVHENWNWSRSNLFFGLPFYHTGVRSLYRFSDVSTVTLAAYNGWNSVVDNNDQKSVSVHLTHAWSQGVASVLYFGGNERSPRAAEGRPWRHLFDSHVTWHATPSLSLLAHANTGFERNYFGTSAWAAAALYARLRIAPHFFVSVRGDTFFEHVAKNKAGRAAAIFWPVPFVASGTATIDFQPHQRVCFRLEFRHDHAGGKLYFRGAVAVDGPSGLQDTLTAGVTTWF